MGSDLIQHSINIQKRAGEIINKLQLLSLWQQQGGQPYIVGALPYGLALAPDIDMEVYFENPTITDGFEVLKSCAVNPGCVETRFRNEMDGPDQGYYWPIRYQEAGGTLWKIDMWSMHQDHPGPTSRDMISPMLNALDEDKRETILTLKQALIKDAEIKCPSIFLYQAVLADGISTFQTLKMWLQKKDTSSINDWHKWLPIINDK